MNIERRTTTHKVEIRAEGEKRKIVGYGAVFGSRSENLGGFREVIEPHAFDDVLADPNTRGLYNHDSSMVLGRNGTTMSLSVDETGLRYEIDPPETSYAKDLMASMERGDVDQSSFQFIVDEDSWDEDDEGVVVRTIKSIKRLIDVSPVTFPAYPEATSDVRDYLVAQKRFNEFKGNPTGKAEQRVSALEKEVLKANEDIAERDQTITRLVEQVQILKAF